MAQNFSGPVDVLYEVVSMLSTKWSQRYEGHKCLANIYHVLSVKITWFPPLANGLPKSGYLFISSKLPMFTLKMNFKYVFCALLNYQWYF